MGTLRRHQPAVPLLRSRCDNALLLQCDALYGKVSRIAAYALFAGVGLGWYLIVALRAGAGA